MMYERELQAVVEGGLDHYKYVDGGLLYLRRKGGGVCWWRPFCRSYPNREPKASSPCTAPTTSKPPTPTS
jgi:hypothetical protein